MDETDQRKMKESKKAIDTPEFNIEDSGWSMRTIRGYRASDSDSD